MGGPASSTHDLTQWASPSMLLVLDFVVRVRVRVVVVDRFHPNRYGASASSIGLTFSFAVAVPVQLRLLFKSADILLELERFFSSAAYVYVPLDHPHILLDHLLLLASLLSLRCKSASSSASDGRISCIPSAFFYFSIQHQHSAMSASAPAPAPASCGAALALARLARVPLQLESHQVNEAWIHHHSQSVIEAVESRTFPSALEPFFWLTTRSGSSSTTSVPYFSDCSSCTHHFIQLPLKLTFVSLTLHLARPVLDFEAVLLLLVDQLCVFHRATPAQASLLAALAPALGFIPAFVDDLVVARPVTDFLCLFFTVSHDPVFCFWVSLSLRALIDFDMSPCFVLVLLVLSLLIIK